MVEIFGVLAQKSNHHILAEPERFTVHTMKLPDIHDLQLTISRNWYVNRVSTLHVVVVGGFRWPPQPRLPFEFFRSNST